MFSQLFFAKLEGTFNPWILWIRIRILNMDPLRIRIFNPVQED
jgi:hypothetical protein